MARPGPTRSRRRAAARLCGYSNVILAGRALNNQTDSSRADNQLLPAFVAGKGNVRWVGVCR